MRREVYRDYYGMRLAMKDWEECGVSCQVSAGGGGREVDTGRVEEAGGAPRAGTRGSGGGGVPEQGHGG